MESASKEELARLERHLAPYERLIRASIETLAGPDVERVEVEVLVHQVILDKPPNTQTISVHQRFDGATREDALDAANQFLASRPEARIR